MELIDIPVIDLVLSEDNVRSKATNIAELAQSIASSGIMVPIQVTPLGDGKYQVVAGERRTLAVRMINEKPEKFGTTVIAAMPATVGIHTDTERIVTMLVENLQREDLSPLDEARGYLRLVDEGQLAQKDIATLIGRSKAHISKRLSLLTLPKSAQKLLTEGKITMEIALQLTKLAEAPAEIEELVDQYFDPDKKREVWDRGELEDDGTIPAWEIEDALRKLDMSRVWATVQADVSARYPAATVQADVTALRDQAPEGQVFTWFDEVEAGEWDGTLPDDEISIVELSWVGSKLYLNFYGYCDVDAPDLADTGPWGDKPTAPPPRTRQENPEEAARQDKAKQAERVRTLVATRRTEHEQAWLASVVAKPKAADLKVLVHRYMIREVTQYNAKELATILGIEPVVSVDPVKQWQDGKGYVEVEGKTRTTRDYSTAVKNWALESDRNADRLAFVLAFHRAENYGEVVDAKTEDDDADENSPKLLTNRLKAEGGYVPFDEAKATVEAEAKVANRKK